jgi:hypothetical protein
MPPKQPLFIHISYTMSYVACRIRCRMCDVVRTMSYTTSYVVLTTSYVPCTISPKKRTISYVFTRFLPVVRAMLYTMSYTTSYVFCTTSYVQRTISPKNVRCRTFLPVSCHFDVRHRIRYRTFFDDVAYDVQCNIGIIRSRTSGSDVVGSHRQKHTT